jgi:hypothetical protein
MRCESKHRYSTRKRALTAASIGGRKRGVALSVYKCELCKYFHLTSQPQFSKHQA